MVTPRGLRLIDEEIDTCRRLLGEAQLAEDKPAMLRASRDLRYWSLRRSTAQVKQPPTRAETVGFGTRVTILRDDGRRQSFAIVAKTKRNPRRD